MTGTVCRAPERRVSPAGIPLSRFLLEHQSVQQEAGLDRQINFRILVVASGDPLDTVVKTLKAGDHVEIKGFLNRTAFKSGEYKLVIHATSVKNA